MRANAILILMLVFFAGYISSASAAASLSVGTISYDTTVVKDESITVTSSVTASSVSGTLSVEATLTDNSGLFTIPTATQQVQFTTDGTQSVSWTITAASTGTNSAPFTILARGDDGGNSASGPSSTVLTVKDRPALSVSISKDVSEVAPGGSVTLGYLVTNSASTGAADATNVVVNISLPGGFSLSSGTSSYSLGSISPQGSISGTWVVTADSPSTTNTFTLGLTSAIPGGTVSTTTSVSSSSTTTSSSGGGSSGGGGGGGGKSAENASNIELIEKYDLQISKDALTSYRFTHLKNPIMFVNITGRTTYGIITTSIEVLKGTSTLVNIPPEGLAYKNANIWVGTSGFATAKNIKEALITFRVENSWMSSNGVSGSDIVLEKWDGSNWIQLETKALSKDDTNSYFEGKTDSFSPFAIVAKTKVVTAPTTIQGTAGIPSPGAIGTAFPPVKKKAAGIPAWLIIVIIVAAVYFSERNKR